ncbi:tRNA dihydrouridine synthase DusB [Angustibacter sp. Root456]|uniref:tRNA dihydrouridine synthase DusB n=1 Tax=Angustibacter sp. Root456 TaxID=1736539 RepID=UPI00070202DB|nr:tRNA-dihydrouridine synthase [Angustibacter sp. Root456]
MERVTATADAPTVAPLAIGPHAVGTPVVLAPMAGITNAAFRQLCRELAGEALADAGLPGVGAGVYVSEMVTSRALVERTPESLRLIQPAPGEHPRSVQLYGVDPATVGAAVRMLVEEDRADHVDLNFGCPVPKVTRKGGGSALPWKATLFRDIVRAAVRAAEPHGVPVTVKMRKGIDDDHLTFLDAGRAAEAEGVAAVALHARTAAQHYSGHADWDAIGELKAAVTTIPVLGNGDIWSADDALAMVRRTGCDGVVVGRGCLGRPWLFADLAAAFAGREVRVQPTLAQVARALRRHAELLAEHYEAAGQDGELKACRDIRKHVAWYLKGFVVGAHVRSNLGLVDSLARLDELLAELDLTQPWPGDAAEGQRGRAGTPQKRVALPEGWLDSRELEGESARAIREAELSVSGG